MKKRVLQGKQILRLIQSSKNSTFKFNDNRLAAINQSKVINNMVNNNGVLSMMNLRPRKDEADTYSCSFPGYKPYPCYKHILYKDGRLGRFLWWTDADESKKIFTCGKRTEDAKALSTKSGYVGHHSELIDVSGTCYMQLVPEIEHSGISHIGAIHQYNTRVE